MVTFMERLLAAAGVEAGDAQTLAEILIRADLQGYPGHGVGHVGSYLDRIESGLIDLSARPEVVSSTDTTAVLDAGFYIGQIAAHHAMSLAIEMAAGHGAGIVCLRRSGHVGRLADYVEMAAERGMIGLAAVSVGGGNVAPYGSMEPIAGTNPIAFGIPGPGGEHIIFDFATAAMSMGELLRKAAAGEPIPDGVMRDGEGHPTTDHARFAGPPRGTLMPFGGYKGSGLHLVAEVLAGLLSGNGPGRDWRDKGASAINAAFFQAIAVERFEPLDAFHRQVADLAEFVRSRKPAPGFGAVRLPGDGSRERARIALAEGVEIHERDWRPLVEHAARLGVEVPAPL